MRPLKRTYAQIPDIARRDLKHGMAFTGLIKEPSNDEVKECADRYICDGLYIVRDKDIDKEEK